MIPDDWVKDLSVERPPPAERLARFSREGLQFVTDQGETLQAEIREHEPVAALEAGEDGLDVVRALLVAAEPATANGAQMLIEIGAEQAPTVVDFAAQHTAWELVAVYPDLNRIERVVHLRRI